MALNPEEIGKRLKSERRRLGYTQEQFSEMLSIGRVHLAKIEIGKKVASLDLLVAINETFGCSLDYIVTGAIKENSSIKESLSEAIKLLSAICDCIE